MHKQLNEYKWGSQPKSNFVKLKNGDVSRILQYFKYLEETLPINESIVSMMLCR
jgi:hypothetical protein